MKPGLIRKHDRADLAMWRALSPAMRFAMLGLGVIDPADVPDRGVFGEAEARDVGEVERAVGQ